MDDENKTVGIAEEFIPSEPSEPEEDKTEEVPV